MLRAIQSYLLLFGISLLAAPFVLAQAPPWNGAECSFRLEPRSVIELGDGTQIKDVGQVVFLGEDRMFVSARNGPGVDVFTESGTFLWPVGRSFEGPIDIHDPGPMSGDNNSIGVLDESTDRILNLDYDGDLIGDARWESGEWSSFITSRHGYIGYRIKPNRNGVLESSSDSGIRVPEVFSDTHSQAIFLEDPQLPLLAGSIKNYYFAFPGTPQIFLSAEGRIQRSNRLNDVDFRQPASPYRSFFAAELGRATGRLPRYLNAISRIVGVYELKDYVVSITSHDWKHEAPQLSMSVYSKGLLFLGLVRFSVGFPDRQGRVPVGFRGNSVFFVVDSPVPSVHTPQSASGVALAEYALIRAEFGSESCQATDSEEP